MEKSSKELEKEESLTTERFKQLNQLFAEFPKDRPYNSYLQLMEWVSSNFSSVLKSKKNLTNLVNNFILVDGNFLCYAAENNIKVQCLIKDSIVSSPTENDFEKFFVQGVFHISNKTTEFLQSSLFYKGNQNEDEVCFFITVSEDNYEGYLNLRNDYQKWSKLRDRSNMNIRVIGGDDITYTKDHTWEDLFLEEKLKEEIKFSVESFLNAKDFYVENNIPWKRGLIFHGIPGNGKTSLIRTIIANYNFKPVTIVQEAENDTIREAFEYAQEQSPSLLYFEDIDSLLENIDLSLFLNLIDGVSSKNGLFIIATANNVSKLKASVMDRPSRFDRKFEIPLPNLEMSVKYLSHLFKDKITKVNIEDLAKNGVKNRFSYVHLKDLYISSMFYAISQKRKKPNKADIDKALAVLVKDRDTYGTNKINVDKYLNKGV